MTDAPVLRHIVMFGFRPEAGESDIAEVVRRFAALAGLVPGIEAFEWGVNNSPEGKNHGMTHCFTLTFGSEAARDVYLPHPDHVAFTQFVRPHLASATVFDYWATTAA